MEIDAGDIRIAFFEVDAAIARDGKDTGSIAIKLTLDGARTAVDDEQRACHTCAGHSGEIGTAEHTAAGCCDAPCFR